MIEVQRIDEATYTIRLDERAQDALFWTSPEEMLRSILLQALFPSNDVFDGVDYDVPI